MSVIDHLKRVPLFEQFSDEELSKIESISEKHGYKVNRTLFHEGDEGSTIYIILVGSVKIYTEKQGKEKIITVLKSGDNFGELALIDSQPRSASAQTLEDSVLISISREPFMEILKENFSATKKIIELLSVRLRVTNQHVNDLVFNDAKANVVKALINLSLQHGERINDTIEIHTKIDKVDLSRYAATTSEIVHLVLEDLTDKGIITYKKHSIYINLRSLKEYQSKNRANL